MFNTPFIVAVALLGAFVSLFGFAFDLLPMYVAMVYIMIFLFIMTVAVFENL
jgi:hypothetical protein